jgi:2-keto-4-pentenoate hydratase/2-oxohepta-3-ene-1,7-dioic acid hydratase in catechol pathway
MKLVTYRADDGAPHLGVLTEDERGIVDVEAAHRARTGVRHPAFSAMLSLINAGPPALEDVRAALAFGQRAGDRALIVEGGVEICAPIPVPPMLRCCSVFLGHYRNVARVVAGWRGESDPDPASLEPSELFLRRPCYYKGNTHSVIGPDVDVIWPRYGERMDFELELALIVGQGGADIRAETYLDHVFGWSVFNDVSARDPQIEEMKLGAGPTKGKDFDTGNVLGPCIVTADAFDPATARAVARVNGEVRGRGDASDMALGWGEILAYRSRDERLVPGEIITSGAFSNCSGIETNRFLEPGDLMELEIEGIGVLRNRIVRPER